MNQTGKNLPEATKKLCEILLVWLKFETVDSSSNVNTNINIE